MAERFKAPVLKTGVRLMRTVGSNPTLSARFSSGKLARSPQTNDRLVKSTPFDFTSRMWGSKLIRAHPLDEKRSASANSRFRRKARERLGEKESHPLRQIFFRKTGAVFANTRQASKVGSF